MTRITDHTVFNVLQLSGIWKGCLNEGTKAPVKLDHADKEAVDLLTCRVSL